MTTTAARYRNFCKPTCKVRWLAFVHGRGDHDEARTAYRVGEGELIAAHHAARASAGWAVWRQHFDVDGSGILWTVHTQHRVSAERRGQGTIQPAWGWRAAYMSGRSKPLSAAGSWSRARPAGWSRRRPTSPIGRCTHFPGTVVTPVSGAHLLEDNRLRNAILQATVPSQRASLTACDAGNAGHAAPSEAARYFWWRRRRWFARGVRGCGPGALASVAYGR